MRNEEKKKIEKKKNENRMKRMKTTKLIENK